MGAQPEAPADALGEQGHVVDVVAQLGGPLRDHLEQDVAHLLGRRLPPPYALLGVEPEAASDRIENLVFAPFRALDKVLFKTGRPARPRIRIRPGRVDTARPLAWAGQLAQRITRSG